VASVAQNTQERVEAAVRDVSDEEIAAFRDKGWVKLERLVDPALTEELLVIAQELVESNDPDDAAGWFAKFTAPSAHNELFHALVYSKRMTRNALRLLGAIVPGNYDAVRYWTDNIFAKYPAVNSEGSTATPFHQDFGNEHSEDRTGKVNFWIALDEVPTERGAMQFFSGSQRLGVLGAGVGTSSGKPTPLEEAYPRLGEWCPLEKSSLSAGDATVHQSLMVHGAAANTTDKTRWSLDALYIQPDASFSGGDIGAGAKLGVEVGKPFDHPALPLLYP
jgi:hypothetical protein